MVEIVLALQAQSGWTWRHPGRVARYAVAFGRRLGLDAEAMMTLQCAAMLHDAGKLLVPHAILDKASPLERDEWYAITKHSMMSGLILKGQAIPRSVAIVAQSHHEWHNGRGYPLGLEGEAIHLEARILSLADAYDAMSNDRPYRRALSSEEILREIVKGAGTQFDPVLVGNLKPMLESWLEQSEQLVPRRTMRVVSDDPALFHELWFAAYPWGWELAPWPAEWADACPVELQGSGVAATQQAAIDLTVVDGGSMSRLPEVARAEIEEPILWVDPPDGQTPAVRRPLDLLRVLSALDPVGDWGVQGSRSAESIRVLVADPFKLFRQALVRFLEDREDLQVVGTVDSTEAYLRRLRVGDFDVAVLASDFVEGTRTGRNVWSGESSGDEQDGWSGQTTVTPSVVLVADEDMEERGKGGGLWEPGRSVENGRVYIARGAPAELLVAAIRAVNGSRPDAREPRPTNEPDSWYDSAGEERQPELWS